MWLQYLPKFTVLKTNLHYEALRRQKLNFSYIYLRDPWKEMFIRQGHEGDPPKVESIASTTCHIHTYILFPFVMWCLHCVDSDYKDVIAR